MCRLVTRFFHPNQPPSDRAPSFLATVTPPHIVGNIHPKSDQTISKNHPKSDRNSNLHHWNPPSSFISQRSTTTPSISPRSTPCPNKTPCSTAIKNIGNPHIHPHLTVRNHPQQNKKYLKSTPPFPRYSPVIKEITATFTSETTTK